MIFNTGTTFRYTDFHEGKDRTRTFRITEVWGQMVHFHDVKDEGTEIVRTMEHLQDNEKLGKIQYFSTQHLTDFSVEQKREKDRYFWMGEDSEFFTRKPMSRKEYDEYHSQFKKKK